MNRASAIQCPYRTHFQGKEAELEGVTGSESAEVVNLAASIRYFSAIFHGAGVDHDDFADETAASVEFVGAQRNTSD